MSASPRILAVLLANLLAPAPAPPGSQPAEKEPEVRVRVATDRTLARNLDAATDSIREEDWRTATEVLQKVLDGKEDGLVQVRLKGPVGKDVWGWGSARAEAQRRLASLPAAGREFYQLTYGPAAAHLLKAARKDQDPERLTEVVRRYLYTEAGPAALGDLAGRHFEAGYFRLAALHYEQLHEHRSLARWTPEQLYQATAAFRRVGDKPHGNATAKQLLDRVGPEGIHIGKRKLTREELQQELDALAPMPRGGDWPLYQGDPARSGRAAGGVPFLDPLWTHKTVGDDNRDTTGVWVEKAQKRLQDRHEPVLTASVPVAVTTIQKAALVHLLIYRSYWGLHAVNVKSGKLEWKTPFSWSLDRMLDKNAEARRIQAANQWLANYVDQNQRPQMVFENSTLGTLSTDNTFVYAVDDLAVPPPYFQAPAAFKVSPYGPDVTNAIHHNCLQAYELASAGKLKWELGGRARPGAAPPGAGELDDSYFLGPPLHLNGHLYVLTQKDKDLRLARIEPARGKVLSVQTLATVREPLSHDPVRRTQAVHLAYSGGILVCPTNAGAVFGVDLRTGSLAWAYTYSEKEDAGPPRMAPVFGGRRGIPPGWVVGPDGRLHPPASLSPQWQASTPVIQDGKVVFTAPDAKSVHCLNLRDGLPLWSHQRTDDDLYLAGVFAGKVLLVGKKGCRALSLAKGEALWNLETGLPSGQGVASDNVYYLPLKEAARSKEPEICAIDVDKGLVLAHTKSRKKLVPGNLLFYEGDVLSQTSTEVAAFPQLRKVLARIDALLAKNPNDPAGLLERAQLRLDKGDLPGAIDDLRKALGSKPPRDTRAQIRARLYDMLTEYFQRDFNAAEKFLKEYEGLCQVDPAGAASAAEKAARQAEELRRRTIFLALLAGGREAQGKPVEALQAYLALGDLGPGDEFIVVPDEPAVKARRDVWVRGRIAGLLQKATPAQRKQLEEEIARKWKATQGRKELDAVRAFVAGFGPETAAGADARLLSDATPRTPPPPAGG
jgi:tetratricopeptide (TPR) repeat protein